MSSGEGPEPPPARPPLEAEIDAVLPRAGVSGSGPDPEPGAVLGDYRLRRRLGSGGFGEVWEAEQLSLRRPVALKLLKPGRVDPALFDYFAREARAGGRLAHPGVVTVHGHGETLGRRWIAMELVEGGRTLHDWLAERRALAADASLPAEHDREVTELVAGLARVLAAVHARGVIHRDLKPRNVFLTPDGRLKLGDFGLALIADESQLSDSGSFAGTYAYMSPEQVSGQRERLDPRTDVFSLGVILYELLALRQPFVGDTPVQICGKIHGEDPPPLVSLRSRIPRDLVVVTGKALEKEPGRRYASMEDLAADLERHLRHEPILARSPGRLERALKWARRHPTRSAAGAVAAVAFVVISALLFDNVRARGLAERQSDELQSLAGFQVLDELVTEADALWPAVPGRVPEYESWLDRARDLLEQRADFERQRRELLAKWGVDAGELERVPDVRERWRLVQLERLLAQLDTFADPARGLVGAGALSAEHGWSVARRLAFARELERAFAPGGAHAARWEGALPALRGAYPGLELDVQMGLVPLGPDPDSGLWEFWDLATGAEPARGPGGRILADESSGVVLVLVPGITSWRGAQDEDPDRPNYEAQAVGDQEPPRAVALSPFLIAKHEMTQGQWLRLCGENPSTITIHRDTGGPPIGLSNPVETVSWYDARRVLPRAGLQLPSEAQWECAARAGTGTPWWSGAERQSLCDLAAGNLADQAIVDAGGEYKGTAAWPELYDGWPWHAPVGSFAPNGFGLHDVVGNVWEWCLDGYDPAFYSWAPDVDPVAPFELQVECVNRGGSFKDTARDSRVSVRSREGKGYAGPVLGLRPARSLRAGSE